MFSWISSFEGVTLCGMSSTSCFGTPLQSWTTYDPWHWLCRGTSIRISRWNWIPLLNSIRELLLKSFLKKSNNSLCWKLSQKEVKDSFHQTNALNKWCKQGSIYSDWGCWYCGVRIFETLEKWRKGLSVHCCSDWAYKKGMLVWLSANLGRLYVWTRGT